jgi:hypothetical protein
MRYFLITAADAVAFIGPIFQEGAGKVPKDFWPPCGRALGPVLDKQKVLFKVPWTGSRFLTCAPTPGSSEDHKHT